MNFFEDVGWFYIAFTSALGHACLVYFIHLGAVRAKRQRLRGELEENLSIMRELDIRAHVDQLKLKEVEGRYHAG